MRKFLAAAFVTILVVGTGMASAQERAQGGSDADIMRVRTRLEAVMADLSKDQNDYGGHKAKAAQFLGSARQELLAAEQFARGQGH